MLTQQNSNGTNPSLASNHLATFEKDGMFQARKGNIKAFELERKSGFWHS